MNSSSDNGNSPVLVHDLSRRFRRKTALDGITLEVPRGQVFGLVGENGAGKTTLIKHILGLLKAQTGTVRVFGLDPVADPENTLSRIGYLSENRDMPAWMRVRELILFTQSFYPDWDAAYAEELRQTFNIDPATKVRDLSRGQRAQAGLLLALAHRPDLLLLDEPSSGLDAVVRRDILGAVIRTVADEGRTVLFSSHLLDEVEYVADQIAILHEGRIVESGPLNDIKAAHTVFTLHFATLPATPPRLESALSCEGSGNEWTFLCKGGPDLAERAAAQLGATVAEKEAPTLEDIFVARVRGRRAASIKEG
jgi:ABC-2 type transport system ATP-binding protein